MGEYSRPGRIAEFDGLRAYALGGVVLFHLLGISGIVRPGEGGAVDQVLWAIFGNTIDFFFIISGFLLFLPLIRRGGRVGSLRDFYLRRFARLQPEYWACLVVVVAMIVLIPVDFQPATPTVGNFLIHVFDLQTAARLFDPGFQLGFWIDGALWMVPVMAGLYLIFPLLARMLTWNVWAAIGTAALVTVCWKLAPGHLPGLFQDLSGHSVDDESVKIIATEQTPGFALSFTLGMAAARLYTWTRNFPDSPWINRAVIATLVLAVPAWLLLAHDFTEAAIRSTTGFDGSSRGRGLVWNGIGSSVLRTSLVLAVVMGPLWLRRPFASRPAKVVADHSYGLYLIHLPVAFYAAQLLELPESGTVGDLLLWSIVVLPVAGAYAWLSRRYIGQPSIRAVENWIGSRGSGIKQS